MIELLTNQRLFQINNEKVHQDTNIIEFIAENPISKKSLENSVHIGKLFNNPQVISWKVTSITTDQQRLGDLIQKNTKIFLKLEQVSTIPTQIKSEVEEDENE